MSVVADTHSLIWYIDAPHQLSPAATTALDAAAASAHEHIFISVITLVETRYLVEKGRIKPDVLTRITQELDEPDPVIVAVSLDRIVADTLASIPRADVPDMPDRIIAATALALGLPLVTTDTKIRALTNVTTVW